MTAPVERACDIVAKRHLGRYHPRVRRRALLAIFTLVITAATWSVSASVDARVSQAGVQIQLLSPGATPRAVARITAQPAAGRRAITFSSQLTQSGISSASVGPLQIQATVSTKPGVAGKNGTIRAAYTYEGFQLVGTSVGTPQQLDAIRTSLAQFQGFSGEYTLSATGGVLANRFQIPSTVNSTLRSLLQQVSGQSSQLTVPLPTQAIGIGARWRGTTQLKAAGISVHQTYEYTLRSREGSRLTLDVHYIQTAPRQKVGASGAPSGTSIDVTSYHVEGRGSTVVDLSQVLPVNGHIAASGRQEFRVKQGSQSGTLAQTVAVGIDIAGG